MDEDEETRILILDFAQIERGVVDLGEVLKSGLEFFLKFWIKNELEKLVLIGIKVLYHASFL